MRPVLRPMLRIALCPAAKYVAGRSTQIAARRTHGFSCVRTPNRVYVIHTQQASEIAGNCAISGIAEKVEICSTRCGLRPATCDLRQSMKRPLVLII